MNINISGEVVRTSQLPKRIIGLGDYLVALNSSPLETSTVLVSDFVSFLNTQFATSLASLTDVSINTPIPGQALVFNGSYWVNQNLVSSLAGLSDVTIASLNPDQLLRYDGTSWKNWTPTFYSLPAGGTTLQYIDGTGALQTFPTALPTGTVRHQVKAGVPITKGQAVYVTSADGTNMIVGLASNASEATSSKTMGLLDATVSTNGFANVVTEGLLTGLDTTGANAAGDPVWLGTNGNLIYGLVNKPYAPNHLVFIGIVTRRNANNGEIFVKVQNGFELDELHNVDARNPSNNDGIFYNSTTQLWEHKQISAVAPTPTLAQVTTAGNTTTNNITVGTLYFGNASHYLVTDNGSYAMLSSNRTLQLATSGNPVLSVFTSQNVAIGTTTDSGYKLDVNGSTRIKGTGTTNATTALLVQNLDATNMLSLTDNGTLTLNAFQQAPTSFIVNRTNTTMGGSFNGASLGTLITINDTVGNSNGSKSTVLINSTGSSVNNAVEIYGGVGIGTAPYGTNFFVAYATTVYNTNRTLAASTFGLSSRSSISTYDAGNGGGISFWGDDRAQGNGNTAFAGIRGIKENSTYVNSLGNLAFYVQASSASLQTETTFIETARFTSGGNLLINTTTNAGYKLDVNGSTIVRGTFVNDSGGGGFYNAFTTNYGGGFAGRFSGNANPTTLFVNHSITTASPTGISSGIVVQFGGTSGGTASIPHIGVWTRPNIGNGSIKNTYGYVSDFPNSSISAGSVLDNHAGFVSGSTGSWAYSNSTITNLYGFLTSFGSQLANNTTVTNYYGIYLNSPTVVAGSSVTNKWGVYQQDSATNNYFAGNVLINTTTDSGYKLDVNGTARVVSLNGISFLTSNEGTTGNLIAATGRNITFVEQGQINTQNGSAFTFRAYADSPQSLVQNASGRTTNFIWVKSGFGGANYANTTGVILNINPTYNLTGTNSGTLIRGIYYNPVLTDLATATHRAIETTSGDVIFNGGNVGIGTTSPTDKLQVAGNVRFGTGAVGTSFFWDNVNGRLGIGNTTPSYKLEVNGGAFFNENIIIANGDGIKFWVDKVRIAPATIDSLGFYTGTTAGSPLEQMRIVSNGNVLIGTSTDAGYKLDVNGTGRFQGNLEVNAGANGQIFINNLYPRLLFGKTGTPSWSMFADTENSGQFEIGTGAGFPYNTFTSRIHISSAGNVGIGITPIYKLDVNGTARIQGNTEISKSGADTQLTVARGSGASFTIQAKADSTSSSEGVNLYWTNNTWLKFVLGSSVVANFSNVGNLLVGTSTDSGYKLDVNGTLRVVNSVRFQNEVAFYSTDGTNKFRIPAGTGWDTQINYGSWGSASIKFLDAQTGSLLLGTTTSTASVNAMLDLQSDNRGLYFNRGTIATMPNLSGNTGTPTYSIISPGSGYTDGTYTGVSATGNYFGNHVVAVTVTGGVVTNIGLWGYGTKVQIGEIFTVAAGALGAGGSGFSFTITSFSSANPGFTFYNTTTNALTYWNGTHYAVPVVSILDRVNIGSSSPADRSAILQVTSTTQGFLAPRLTTAEILLIASPAEGLQVYNTDLKTICFYNGTAWQRVTSTAM